MKWRLIILCFLPLGATLPAFAQEANSGFDLAATVSAQGLYSRELSNPPRDAKDVIGAYRAVLYPTWKVNQNWSVSAAVEAYSYPYFFEDLSTDKHGSSIKILHADVSYSRFWKNRSVVLRAGQLSSAFGSFPFAVRRCCEFARRYAAVIRLLPKRRKHQQPHRPAIGRDDRQSRPARPIAKFVAG